MRRLITLFSGQFADMTLGDFTGKARAWGYEGVELACWGEHLNVGRLVSDRRYVDGVRRSLGEAGLECRAISTHLVSQAVCEGVFDERHRKILPSGIWGNGDWEGIRLRAEERIKETARAAAAIGADTVVGFTGSPMFYMFNGWPPVPWEMVEGGYADFGKRWGRILDVFEEVGVKYALEIMPGEIAYDVETWNRAYEAVGRRENFGVNLDPTHLVWQMLDVIEVVRAIGGSIFHVHCKDARMHLTGLNSVLGSHLPPGRGARAWEFVTVGRGEVPFEGMVRMLDNVGYEGPLSVEWEDSLMDREQGAIEGAEYMRRLRFAPASSVWSSAFVTKD
jgi:sugar phosphate isomerase/epimerase